MNVRSEIVRSRNCHYGHSGRSLQLGTPNARAIWHVAAIPGRRRCEFNHHRNPRINIMTMVVQVARAMGTKQQSHSSLVLIVVMIPTISVLMAAHVIEVFVWALAYLILDVAPAGANLVYFAFVNYATLGYGDVLPVESWRLLGPLTAMNACCCLDGRPQSLSRSYGERWCAPLISMTDRSHATDGTP